VLVAAVLGPEQREDRELEVVRRSPEQRADPLELLVRQAERTMERLMVTPVGGGRGCGIRDGRQKTTLASGEDGGDAARRDYDSQRMAFIRLIEESEATGALAHDYDEAVGRAGRVFNIVKAMSLNPSVLRSSIRLYRDIMFGPSELTRIERELLAVVVSATNDCFY
jgi:hypothetical protein